MSTAVRYTPQMQQELRSRFQLAERLVEFGWIPVVPEDLGEDFIIHIYHEGRATGVNFFVQLKSVTNLNGRRKGDSLPYSFEVKDLLHWEQFLQPVVLIVWDVKLREGRWTLISDTIKQLDQKHPNWRQQKTKTVQIPWQNSFLEDSLVSLRHRIGEIFYPQIFKDKSFEFNGTVSFPNSEEGKKELQAFENAIKDGDSGSWDVQLEIPQELVPWLGGPIVENAKLFREPLASGKRFPTSVTAYDLMSQATSLNIEFQVVKIGTESVTVSNYHQDSFLHFLFVFVSGKTTPEKAAIAINEEAKHLGRNSFEARDVLEFLYSIATRGQLRVDFEVGQKYSLIAEIPDAKRYLFLPPREFRSLIDKLCVIEGKFGFPLEVPFGGLSAQDAIVIEELFEVIRSGKRIRKNQEITIDFIYQPYLENILKAAFHKGNIRVSTTLQEKSLNLLQRNFQLGNVLQFISGKPVLPNGIDNITSLKPGESFRLKVQESTMEELFPRLFLEEAERLGQLLASEFAAKSIYLFGSLAWSETYSPQTDIDLAVSGLKPDELYKAIGYLESNTGFSFDLINLAEATPALRERIIQEGKLLYERELVAVGG
ncbi:DUF4365 domain-containing protein [Candidatus Leptofilum sp.]|uniref:DUF4365 domain-containing protein n=1 Tax=Candidatus Leptofilum sp. TaxID=3241576 RepID=UPI003B5C44E2